MFVDLRIMSALVFPTRARKFSEDIDVKSLDGYNPFYILLLLFEQSLRRNKMEAERLKTNNLKKQNKPKKTNTHTHTHTHTHTRTHAHNTHTHTHTHTHTTYTPMNKQTEQKPLNI